MVSETCGCSQEISGNIFIMYRGSLSHRGSGQLMQVQPPPSEASQENAHIPRLPRSHLKKADRVLQSEGNSQNSKVPFADLPHQKPTIHT